MFSFADDPDLSFFPSVADFVERSGGVRVIEYVLIANNGIAAVKCIRYVLGVLMMV